MNEEKNTKNDSIWVLYYVSFKHNDKWFDESSVKTLEEAKKMVIAYNSSGYTESKIFKQTTTIEEVKE